MNVERDRDSVRRKGLVKIIKGWIGIEKCQFKSGRKGETGQYEAGLRIRMRTLKKGRIRIRSEQKLNFFCNKNKMYHNYI